MSARSDQSKSMFSVFALCLILAGGAIIASTDVGAQTVDRPSKYRAKGASKVYPRSDYERMPSGAVKGGIANPCGHGWHMGRGGKCFMGSR
jgi:hypothetical protein